MMAQILDLSKIMEARDRAKRIEGSELEVCVSCNEFTDTPIDTPVDLRPNYIDGVGDYCNSCYDANVKATKQLVNRLDRRRYGE